ncbi:MAG: carboxypeptidase regulatory-like domain-containing protein [Fimbriimonadaceae bacterium]|nr:carboxypeptidase regulatory-like domain-containing protein [Fimbriimonadaceae bacterium]
MAMLFEERLDAYLAADPLPPPPAAVLDQATRLLREHHRPSADARQSWLARLAQVREDFLAALQQPSLATFALASRAGSAATVELPGAVSGDADAALGHAVQGLNVRGQVFLTALESPADLEVELRFVDGELLEQSHTDPLGRFRFLGLAPGRYELLVPTLGLVQPVEIPA